MLASATSTKQSDPVISPVPVKVFFSYCKEDLRLRDKLAQHLDALQRQNKITSWHDRQITPGAESKAEIDTHLETSRVILLLVSAAFIASDYCYEQEMTRAMELHEGNQAKVIPVILRPCSWQDAPFGKLNPLPSGGKPVTRWSNQDEAFTDIVKGIDLALAELPQRTSETEENDIPEGHTDVVAPQSPSLSGQYAILFTDLQGSSVLNQKIGDVVYQEQVLYPHFRELQQAAAVYDGHQSGDPAGDSMMFVFRDIAQAIEAAVKIQEGMRDHPSAVPDGDSVATRIGIHYSRKQLRADEQFGFNGNSDCNYAARVMGIAHGGQILLSQEAHEAAQTARTEWKAWPNRLIKSFEETPRTVYELCWDANTSKGEPGAQFLPDWYVAHNEYIPRPTLEVEIMRLLNPKRPDHKFSRLVTLHGFGGIGKTRLAMQCAVQLVGAFDGRVRFVPLGQGATDNLATEQDRCDFLAQAIGKIFAPDKEPATPANLLQYVPATTNLLLLDNWETVEGRLSAELVALLLTKRPNLVLLVTGRQCVHIDDIEHEIEVEGMLLPEAQELFLTRLRQKKEYRVWTPTVQDEAAITNIVNALDGIALAIELVAANAGRGLVLIAHEIQERILSENTTRRRGHISVEITPRHASLQASLDWSWDLLEEIVQYALCCLGLFAQPFNESDALSIFPRLTLDGIIGLREAALMQFNITNPRPYSLLRVTREYAQEKRNLLGGTISDEIESNFILHYRRLMEEYKQGVYEHSQSILAILDALHPDANIAFLHAIERNEEENVTALYKTLARYQSHRSLLVGNRLLEETMLAFRRKVLPDGHPDIATSLNNLANLYSDQGYYSKAEILHSEALAIRRTVLPCGHADIANSLNNLAGLYCNQGRSVEAEPLYNEALEIWHSAFPEGHPDIATCLNNVAELYRNKGRFAEAKSLHDQALSMRRALWPDGHPDIANSLNNLALSYGNLGRDIEAKSLFQEALAIRRTALPLGHPEIANSLINLAAVYCDQGHYTDAEPLYSEALSICRVYLSKEHPLLASALSKLALLYKDQGRYVAVEPLLQEALAIRRSILPEGHSDIATGLDNLAEYYRSQGFYPMAEPLHQEALAIRLSALPEGHPDIAISLNNLALLYYNQGRYEEALKLMKEAWEIMRASLGEVHPNTKMVAVNYAYLVEKAGQSLPGEGQEQNGLT